MGAHSVPVRSGKTQTAGPRQKQTQGMKAALPDFLRAATAPVLGTRPASRRLQRAAALASAASGMPGRSLPRCPHPNTEAPCPRRAWAVSARGVPRPPPASPGAPSQRRPSRGVTRIVCLGGRAHVHAHSRLFSAHSRAARGAAASPRDGRSRGPRCLRGSCALATPVPAKPTEPPRFELPSVGNDGFRGFARPRRAGLFPG